MGGFIGSETHATYDVHPGGERFVMVENPRQNTEIRVWFNWFDHVRRQLQASGN